MMKDFFISRMDESEIDALFEFRKKIFPVNRKQMDRARWRWFYLNHPDYAGSLPVWLIRSEGRIVGSIGSVPTRIKVGKSCWMASFGTDYFVEREFLGFPALRLLKTMLAESPLHIGANLSASAQRLFAKMGYADLSDNLFSVGTSIPAIMPGMGGLHSYLKTVSRKTVRKIACPFPFEIEITARLPDSYQEFWETILPFLEVTVIKDARYMKWRYEQCPSVDYRFILSSKGGKLRSLAAVAVIPDRDPNAAGRGVILDLLAQKGDHSAVCVCIEGCLEYFSRNGCHAVDSHLSGSWTSRCFSLMGFSRKPSQLGLMVLAAKENTELRKTRDARSWAFALGDTDRY